MNGTHNSYSEAYHLAHAVANRYGRLALTRAAGEAAAADRQGDIAKRDLWSSVVAYLRQTIQSNDRPVIAPA